MCALRGRIWLIRRDSHSSGEKIIVLCIYERHAHSLAINAGTVLPAAHHCYHVTRAPPGDHRVNCSAGGPLFAAIASDNTALVSATNRHALTMRL